MLAWCCALHSLATSIVTSPLLNLGFWALPLVRHARQLRRQRECAAAERHLPPRPRIPLASLDNPILECRLDSYVTLP